MSSLCAASITVLPPGTCTCWPSISRLIVVVIVSDVIGHEAALVIDVVLELVAEVLDETLHRQRRRIAERTDRSPSDIVGNGKQQIEILVFALPVLDAIDHAPQPARALAAWRALSAGFLEVEIRQSQQRAHHAARIVHADHGT